MTEQVKKLNPKDIVICSECGAKTFRVNKVLVGSKNGDHGKYKEAEKCRFCGGDTSGLAKVVKKKS